METREICREEDAKRRLLDGKIKKNLAMGGVLLKFIGSSCHKLPI